MLASVSTTPPWRSFRGRHLTPDGARRFHVPMRWITRRQRSGDAPRYPPPEPIRDKCDGGVGWGQLVKHPLYSPEKAPTHGCALYPTNMVMPREGGMVGFTQFHHLVVVGGCPWRCTPSRRSRRTCASDPLFCSGKRMGKTLFYAPGEIVVPHTRPEFYLFSPLMY